MIFCLLYRALTYILSVYCLHPWHIPFLLFTSLTYTLFVVSILNLYLVCVMFTSLTYTISVYCLYLFIIYLYTVYHLPVSHNLFYRFSRCFKLPTMSYISTFKIEICYSYQISHWTSAYFYKIYCECIVAHTFWISNEVIIVFWIFDYIGVCGCEKWVEFFFFRNARKDS